jgi:hypothetical protein
MLIEKTLFRIPNPLRRFNKFYPTLLSVEYSKNTHIGLGGIEPHSLLEINILRGAGYPYSRSFYIGRDLFARDKLGDESIDSAHVEYSPTIKLSPVGRAQAVRIPWQIGYTSDGNVLPFCD